MDKDFKDLQKGLDDSKLQGDSSYKCDLSDSDLEQITLLEQDATINSDLFVVPKEKQMDASLVGLFCEDSISGVKTGKDAGIYKYKPVKGIEPEDNFDEYEELLKHPIISKATGDISKFTVAEELTSIIDPGISQEVDTSFTDCMLAQYDPWGGPETQVIRTFKGYLEISRPLGILRCGDGCLQEVETVYIPEFYIDKYLLRNGDEIGCVYNEVRGKFVVESLLTINGEVCSNWNTQREWFDDIQTTSRKLSIKAKENSELLNVINTLELRRADNVFVHLKNGVRESGWIKTCIKQLDLLFEKVVVINPKIRSVDEVVEGNNVVNFCAKFTDTTSKQIMACVLGANYVKRLVEMSKTVAVVVDDLNYVASLDNGFNGETPVLKTVFSCIKANKKGGAIMFGLLPASSVEGNFNMLNSLETARLVVDKGEIDLFSSYRV